MESEKGSDFQKWRLDLFSICSELKRSARQVKRQAFNPERVYNETRKVVQIYKNM